MVESLFQATDYRVWLRGALRNARRSHPARTMKALAQALDIDPAHLSRVLGGHKHLAVRHVPGVSEFLELKPDHARYLEELVRCNTAPDARAAGRHFLAMRAMRGELGRTLEDDAHDYFSSWVHPVMRTLLSLVEFRGLGWSRLGQLFRRSLSPEQARESVELLGRLGLVEPDARGILRPTAGTVRSGEAWKGQAVHAFQKQTLGLASDLLDTVPRAERDVSTLTLPASRKRMPELYDRIRRFREETMAWARDLPEEDCVVQLNIQLFPVADARLSDRPRPEARA